MSRTPVIVLAALLVGCASTPPENPSNVCSIFSEKEDWYTGARAAERRWGVPVSVQMAIVQHESGFVDDARPPRNWFLGIVPLGRKSSAYGYGQVLDDTWEWYQAMTGRDGADRDEFDDVVDFIGWYGHQSRVRLGIPTDDAYRQYLAYHEGHGGYVRGSYRRKPWLQRVARQVAANATRYRRQLTICQASLERTVAAR